MNFEQLNLRRELLAAVADMGYTEPTPIQKKTIPQVLQGRDVLGCAQTGTGKTAAFALPILQRLCKMGRPAVGTRPIRALILTPTRELALQIYENFVQYGQKLPLKSAVIFGGVNQNPQVEILRAGVDVLVATPGRLNDLIAQGVITLDDIRIFVLDEADRMLDMGFIHDVRKVIDRLPEKRQTLLFSATMPAEVEEIAACLLSDPVTVKVSPVTSTVDAIDQSVYYLAKEDKVSLLLTLLDSGIGQTLLFVRTKHGADAVARKLQKNGIKALAIHGDKSQNARQNALSQFKSGKIDVLVATDIAARGIDISELPCVINYNIPEEPETYIHRIGRTGRAGLSGRAISFCSSDELDSFRDIEKLIGKKVEEKTCEWSVQNMVATKYVRPQRVNPNKNVAQGQKRSTSTDEANPQTSGKAGTTATGKTERRHASVASAGERIGAPQKNAAKTQPRKQVEERAGQNSHKARSAGFVEPRKGGERSMAGQDRAVSVNRTSEKDVRTVMPAEKASQEQRVEKKAPEKKLLPVQTAEKQGTEAEKHQEKARNPFLRLFGGRKKDVGKQVEPSQPTQADTARVDRAGAEKTRTAEGTAEEKTKNDNSVVVPHHAGVPYYYEPAKRTRMYRMSDPMMEGHKTSGGGNEIVTKPERKGGASRYVTPASGHDNRHKR